MSYETDKNKLSRESLTIVKLNLDATISDTAEEYLTDGTAPKRFQSYPCVSKIDWLPTKAAEFGGVGAFGEIDIHCQDFPFENVGTYFGRLLANNPYYLDRLIQVYVGFSNPDFDLALSDFDDRSYFLKKIIGPDDKGKVILQCADAISILKEDLVPRAESSNLTAALTESATRVYCDPTQFTDPTYLTINDEIMSYTTIQSDGFSGLSRGLGGTTAAAHDLDDSIRASYHYNGNSLDAVRSVIDNYSDIDPSYINIAAWADERDTYLNASTVDIWLTEPKKISDLMNEIGEQVYCSFWWDDAAQEIKVKGLGPRFSTPDVINDQDNILDRPVKVVRDQRKIITRIWYHFGKIDQTSNNDSKNYQGHLLRINTEAEAGLGRPVTKEIFADHIPYSGLSTASTTASRLMSQTSSHTNIKLYLDIADSDYQVGELIDVQSDVIQNTDGTPAICRMRVISRALDKNNQYQYEMVKSGLDATSTYGVIAPNNIGNYSAESPENQNQYMFIADSSNELDGDPAKLIL